ncbi:hypothetical protein F4703DRAFT_1779508 [Phycomyces blakesleeanus]
MTSLQNLPSELLFNCLSWLPLRDLATTRTVSITLQHFCDDPFFWRHLWLEPPEKPSKSIALWQLSDLKALIEPHLEHIQSIRIRGVRDNIVRYILNNCPNLEELTICGWTTLSDHAFKFTQPLSSLRRLELVGAANQTNFTSLDATTLGRLLTRCPGLTELLLGCQVHIHAPTFITLLKSTSCLPLRFLTLATRRTWSSQHLADLMILCPRLECVSLLSAAAAGFNIKEKDTLGVHSWIAEKHHLSVAHPDTRLDEDDWTGVLAEDVTLHRSLFC